MPDCRWPDQVAAKIEERIAQWVRDGVMARMAPIIQQLQTHVSKVSRNLVRTWNGDKCGLLSHDWCRRSCQRVRCCWRCCWQAKYSSTVATSRPASAPFPPD